MFDVSVPGRRASTFPTLSDRLKKPQDALPAHFLRRQAPLLPEVSELDLVRHYTNLSRKNWGIDVGSYPLGSCTMKYNPKVHEQIAALSGFQTLHPWQPQSQTQGAMALLYEMERHLAELTGMARVTFQPSAGAAGELAGLLIIKAHHSANGSRRDTIVIPDSAHGTNPATVNRAGYKVRQISSGPDGLVDLTALEKALDDDVAGFMLTNPNTLGRFETEIETIAKLVHGAGGLLYYDGANLNAIMGVTRPGDMGFDVVHMNLHKTMTTPHGGGGPGSGPVAVSAELEQYLPAPLVGFNEDSAQYFWDTERPDSIGRVHGFNGNFAVVLRAYAYVCSIGGEGLRRVSERAVLNANYLLKGLQPHFPPGIKGTKAGDYLHEFVVTSKRYRANGVRAMDIAKRLIDLGFHPPTVYFPQIVEEAMMFEPTETESKSTLDSLAGALTQIAREAEETPEVLKRSPQLAATGRLDEAGAARLPRLRWWPAGERS
ncbi:MAG: aminomethyl-transferring glycine dehydrogenase subunit GcvPB [Actinomycetota bacterium]